MPKECTGEQGTAAEKEKEEKEVQRVVSSMVSLPFGGFAWLTSLCCLPLHVAHREEDDDQEMRGEDDVVDDDFTLGEAISYYRDMREKEEVDDRHSCGVRVEARADAVLLEEWEQELSSLYTCKAAFPFERETYCTFVCVCVCVSPEAVPRSRALCRFGKAKHIMHTTKATSVRHWCMREEAICWSFPFVALTVPFTFVLLAGPKLSNVLKGCTLHPL